jgi:hypothetical protein
MFARFVLTLCLSLAPILAPMVAMAETPMSGNEFEAYVTGKTITFDYGEGILGMEQYLPGRQVRWAFEGDTCLDGTWFQEADQICFVYENDGIPQCWHFYSTPTGLNATFLGDDLGSVIKEINKTSDPLVCAGPDVGV